MSAKKLYRHLKDFNAVSILSCILTTKVYKIVYWHIAAVTKKMHAIITLAGHR